MEVNDVWGLGPARRLTVQAQADIKLNLNWGPGKASQEGRSGRGWGGLREPVWIKYLLSARFCAHILHTESLD